MFSLPNNFCTFFGSKFSARPIVLQRVQVVHKIHRSLTYLKAKTVHLQKHLTGEKYNKEQIGVFLEIVQPCRLPIMLSSQNARIQKDQYDDQPKHPLRFACFACMQVQKKLWLFSADKNMRALAFAKKNPQQISKSEGSIQPDLLLANKMIKVIIVLYEKFLMK